MRIRAILDRVVIEPSERIKETEGGYDTSGADIHDHVTRGKVLSCGKGTVKEEMEVKIGDTVWFNKHAGTRLNVELDPTKTPKPRVIVPQNEIMFIEEDV